jgi:hypothetical protein
MANSAQGLVVILFGAGVLLFRKKYGRRMYEGGRFFGNGKATAQQYEKLATAVGIALLIAGTLILLGFWQ